jgi:protocatechuate 3,4-dioxygenase beta subunit
MDEHLTRRSLLRLAGLAAAAVGADALKGGGWLTDEAAAGPAAVASGAVSCVLAPEQTEGPYYLANEKIRRNITEGRPGRPLTLRLAVVDASTCKPIRGAAVDVWHCDALGNYSGVDGDNGTFMRGIQRTNPRGIATFRTVYPGWYQGRTVHIHVKVHVRGNVVHTGQLYFPDRVTDAVYRRSPYSGRPNRDVRNPADAIYRNGGKRSLLRLTKSGAGYVGTMRMGVHR